jgi:hypothetical protein
MSKLTCVSPELEPGLLHGESSLCIERPERFLSVNTGEQLDGTQPVLPLRRQTRNVRLPCDAGVRKSAVITDIEGIRDEVDGDRQLRKRGLSSVHTSARPSRRRRGRTTSATGRGAPFRDRHRERSRHRHDHRDGRPVDAPGVLPRADDVSAVRDELLRAEEGHRQREPPGRPGKADGEPSVHPDEDAVPCRRVARRERGPDDRREVVRCGERERERKSETGPTEHAPIVARRAHGVHALYAVADLARGAGYFAK